MKNIILKGNPKSTQHCYKFTCFGKFPRLYMSKDCKDIKESYKEQTKKQWKRKVLEGDIELEIKLFFGTKRIVDIDNFNKLTLDSLSGVIYKDDSQIKKMTVSKHYDKTFPRIEILIK